MTRLILVLILIHITTLIFCQSIGVKVSYNLSAVRQINNSWGYGAYININDFSNKMELLFTAGYHSGNKTFQSSDSYSSYHQKFINSSLLFVIP